jgi:hypothetical protein
MLLWGADAGPSIRPNDCLIQRARASAGGGRIHHVEQLIGAYRMYGAVLQRRPADSDSRQKFRAVESQLERQAF